MKYVTIPPPEVIGGKPLPLSQLMDEQVWPNPYWRGADGVDRSNMLFEVSAKFAGKDEGDVVELTDKEFEALLPLVSMRGQQLAPAMALPLQRLMRSFFDASTDAPKGESN